MIFGDQERQEGKRDYQSKGHEHPQTTRAQHGHAPDDPNDDGDAGAGIVDRLP